MKKADAFDNKFLKSIPCNISNEHSKRDNKAAAPQTHCLRFF